MDNSLGDYLLLSEVFPPGIAIVHSNTVSISGRIDLSVLIYI